MKNKYKSLFLVPCPLFLLFNFLETQGSGKCKGRAVWCSGSSLGFEDRQGWALLPLRTGPGPILLLNLSIQHYAQPILDK